MPQTTLEHETNLGVHKKNTGKTLKEYQSFALHLHISVKIIALIHYIGPSLINQAIKPYI